MSGKKYRYITVRVDDEIEQLLEERMEYLKKSWKVARVTKSDAIRHALTRTGYSRKKKNSDSDIDTED